jgi:glucose/arabinose dehydrogenase
MAKRTGTWLRLVLAGAAILAVASPAAAVVDVGVKRVADGFTSPVTMAAPLDHTARLFVADQIGVISIVKRGEGKVETPFLDLRGRITPLDPVYDERGLLGLAFHPKYVKNGLFYVYYTIPLRPGAPDGYDHTGRISEFRVSQSDPDVADPSSERVLLEWDHPQLNHDGGTLAFGPDDHYLYISIGDGGGANDVDLGHVEDWYDVNAGGNGQDVEANLLGNVLRIDVNQGSPYGIPPDNPFVGRDGLDEIYAYGLRNPYRFSFDMGGDHKLILGDAGQDLWEEVSVITKGGNYGWNVKEGTHCFSTADPGTVLPSCPSVVGPGHPDEGAPLIDPVIEYAHPETPDPDGLERIGDVVVGGYVYRGRAMSNLFGHYIFGDWSTDFGVPDGTLLVADPTSGPPWSYEHINVVNRPGGKLGSYILGFGQDEQGNVYVLTTQNAGPSGTTGQVLRIVPPRPR